MKLINMILPHLLLKLTSRYRMVPNIQVPSQTKTNINQQLYPSIAPDFGTTRAFKTADIFKNISQQARSSTIFLQSQPQSHMTARVLPSETYAAEPPKNNFNMP